VNVFIVSASGGQKPQFWANFDIWGSHTNPLLPMRVKFRVLEQTQGHMYTPNVVCCCNRILFLIAMLYIIPLLYYNWCSVAII